MAQVRTQELVWDTQTNLLDYLRRADARQERQNHVVLTALGEIHKGQENIARLVVQQSEMLREVYAITVRVME